MPALLSLLLLMIGVVKGWHHHQIDQEPSASAPWHHQLDQASSASSPWHHQYVSHHHFLLPPYPQYRHQVLPPTNPPSAHRYYSGEVSEGNFGDSYNELGYESPYQVAPIPPILLVRLSSGVLIPVKAVYSFPPFIERLIQRVQGFYSIYNPPDTLTIDRPIPAGGPTVTLAGELPPPLPTSQPPNPTSTQNSPTQPPEEEKDDEKMDMTEAPAEEAEDAESSDNGSSTEESTSEATTMLSSEES